MRILVCCLLLLRGASATVFPLVLCNGLNASQRHVRALEVSMHAFPGALLEEECVRIDPCAETNERGQAVPAGVWLWRNDSALWLDGNDTEARRGTPQSAYNFHSLEFARVPEGVLVRACEPDFSVLRLYGRLECAAGTEVVLDRRLGVPACPSTVPFTLLDCMASLQKHPVLERLPFRAKNTHMAFGSLTWYAACGANLTAEGRALCDLLESAYELRLPLATAASRTQLVRYDFSEGYGCFGSGEVGVGQRLTRAEHPNKVVACPEVEHGEHQASADPVACVFTCLAGYTKTATGCELGCATADGSTLTSTACPDGEFVSAQCEGGGVTYFQCSACPEVPGSAVRAWSLQDPASCRYDVCAAGSAGAGNQCVSCPPNSYAPHSNMSACLPCDANSTGLYQPLAGQTSCSACFASAPSGVCAPGEALVASYQDIKTYFARTGLHRHENMTAYCMQGFACLPCEPGSVESGAACVLCEPGTYQPHFRRTACFPCSRGQSTNRSGATDASECLCQEGFE